MAMFKRRTRNSVSLIQKLCSKILLVCKTNNNKSASDFKKQLTRKKLLCYSAISLFILILISDALFQTTGTINLISDDTSSNKPLNLPDLEPWYERSEIMNYSYGFSVVINSYKRPERLRRAALHYAQCPDVGHVYIIWCEEDKKPPKDEEVEKWFAGGESIRGGGGGGNRKFHAPVTMLENKNSLNSRFLPIKKLGTDAVFMVDDDIQVNCEDLYQGYLAWTMRKDALVGYYPRIHTEKRSSSSIIYHTWLSVFFKTKFSIILTKACFLHKKYMELYSSAAHPQEIKDYIDERFNCEDIAMALLVANATRTANNTLTEAPIYVEGKVKDLGVFGGISTGSDHFASRSDCLTDLTAIYEKHGWQKPLINVDMKGNTWTRHYPGFSWQFKPSTIFEWFPSADILQS